MLWKMELNTLSPLKKRTNNVLSINLFLLHEYEKKINCEPILELTSIKLTAKIAKTNCKRKLAYNV